MYCFQFQGSFIAPRKHPRALAEQLVDISWEHAEDLDQNETVVEHQTATLLAFERACSIAPPSLTSHYERYEFVFLTMAAGNVDSL